MYASAYQPEFCGWAFPYLRSQDRYNPQDPASTNPDPKNSVPDHSAIDIMITHGPPQGILDLNYPRLENCGCEHLRRAVERCKPQLHCFGHIHEAWGAVRKKWNVDSWDADFGTPSSTTKTQKSKGKEVAKPPYSTTEHPSTYYMYPSQAQTNQAGPGETLIVPESYKETQVPEMCAKIDATDLEFGKETLFVNASIMNLRYAPKNAPWLVDLMLPAAGGGEGEDSLPQ